MNKVKGIILSYNNYSEFNRIFNVLEDSGDIITINAIGVRRPKAKLASAMQLLNYNEFEIIGKSRLIGTKTLVEYRLNSIDQLNFLEKLKPIISLVITDSFESSKELFSAIYSVLYIETNSDIALSYINLKLIYELGLLPEKDWEADFHSELTTEDIEKTVKLWNVCLQFSYEQYSLVKDIEKLAVKSNILAIELINQSY